MTTAAQPMFQTWRELHCAALFERDKDRIASRIKDAEKAMSHQHHRTTVRPFPISVDLTDTDDEAVGSDDYRANYLERSALMRSLGVNAAFLGVGVDRVDYTKGILERFRAIERFASM
jgi:trehalose-6-phosphate synthase